MQCQKATYIFDNCEMCYQTGFEDNYFIVRWTTCFWRTITGTLFWIFFNSTTKYSGSDREIIRWYKAFYAAVLTKNQRTFSSLHIRKNNWNCNTLFFVNIMWILPISRPICVFAFLVLFLWSFIRTWRLKLLYIF